MRVSTYDVQVTAPITWVDVARALCALDPASSEWHTRPAGLKRIRVDWAGAVFEVQTGQSDPERIKGWLKTIVPGLLIDVPGDAFLLDGPHGLQRLPIEFEESLEPIHGGRMSLGAIDGDVTFSIPTPSTLPGHRPVPVIACHSVKGGTGRTTSVVAIASIWQKRASKPILVIDADIEAPGLSYLFSAARGAVRISFEDLIALAHASVNSDKSEIAMWVAERLQSQRIGQLIIMPLRRALDELASSTIRAEHLASQDNPHALADLISITAQAAGCAGVIVDLRAGLVPIATQLMLDPNVLRVLCTSLSNQSTRATGSLVSFIARELRKLTTEPPTPPLIIVNRIPSAVRDYGTDDQILEPMLEQIETSLLPDDGKEVGSDRTILDSDLELKPFVLIKINEIPDLQVPRAALVDFAVQLETSGYVGQMRYEVSEWLDLVLPASDLTAEVPKAITTKLEQPTAQMRRKQLNDFSRNMEFAESTGAIQETLVTRALRAFSQEGQAPVVISEGAKGTGKTLTARYLIKNETWQNAIRKLTDSVPVFDAEIVPVVSSIVGSNEYIIEVDQRRKDASESLKFGEPQKATQTKNFLLSEVAKRRTQPEWTQLWLDVIAWAVGVEVGNVGAGERLLMALRGSGRRMIAIIEGIEEIRPTTADASLVAMLGSLLIDLPARLRTEQGRPLGLIVFARRDTVDIGVPQNALQFRQQYRNFALTWDESDVLELAAWLATKSGALPIWDRNFRSKTKLDQEQLLEQLWGRKLGPDERDGKRTQEAYTANWVLAVLSDLQGRLTARDLVRFIKEASEIPVTPQDDSQYSRRILVPNALRRAVGPTSSAKVIELQEEVPSLKEVFSKIKQHKNAVKAPISQEAVRDMGISSDELGLLQTHGVILDESPPYEVPELFRIGLELAHGGARRNVIGIMRRAKERGNARGVQ